MMKRRPRKESKTRMAMKDRTGRGQDHGQGLDRGPSRGEFRIHF